MASVKVTLFQKDLNRPIGEDLKGKLNKEKSDFLLLPEYFPFYESGANPDQSSAKSKFYIDELLQISEYYKGVIIGGSVFRKDDAGILRISVPIIQGVVVADWYDKQNLAPFESGAVAGDGERIFIMGGLRFGIAAGKEIDDSNRFEELKSQNVNLLFHCDFISESESTHALDLERYAKLSARYGTLIARTTGVGSVLGKTGIGRSLLATSSGVNWKVAESEKQKEILKTVIVNGVNGLF
ncbi:amidohydrolase [Leptospira gomenensis]|uniref:Amidohydrolase n=1 Tax=Leptospira gomenensis TaxID=2484974 RepID=A0A5F1Y6P2_9LEPT|nr:amidohydrolase [Leptospira gomenensis]TGK28964.1 amidohydrolase [Leptospira gomenensis]TGK35425.1 amidohydrolase [Leptospira gomenensis]TGK40723.1 amidohydrolase [Leptospira gomenensis]TGK68433.1 amidohydrolase [Leptospira gomenensis]